ncbi:hypothetical protein WY02_03460 [Pseudonocardia sp. AL041005-10]|nr:hypothetical protein [Pseudonocardia sp. AL041005-10]ALE77661.1 hypothetical protein WY02_03460 [Pseudonocardia sp. AL041005-10]
MLTVDSRAVEAALSRVRARLARLNVFTRLTTLEDRMSQIDAALAELNDATNEVAADLDALEAQVAEIDSATAGKIRAAADRLRGLAADPEQPVPPAETGPDSEGTGSTDQAPALDSDGGTGDGPSTGTGETNQS